MPEQPRLDVLGPQRLAQQRVVLQVDLGDRQVVGGLPPGDRPLGGRSGGTRPSHRGTSLTIPRRAPESRSCLGEIERRNDPDRLAAFVSDHEVAHRCLAKSSAAACETLVLEDAHGLGSGDRQMRSSRRSGRWPSRRSDRGRRRSAARQRDRRRRRSRARCCAPSTRRSQQAARRLCRRGSRCWRSRLLDAPRGGRGLIWCWRWSSCHETTLGRRRGHRARPPDRLRSHCGE